MVSILFFLSLLGGIIQLPPANELPPSSTQLPTYQQLGCTSKEKADISYIITTMAEKGSLALLAYKNDLTKRGQEIAHIHPLKFLGVIFSDPELKEAMKKIQPAPMKWNRFMGDLRESLDNRMTLGQITPYLKDFSEEVSGSLERIEGYAQSRDWDGLIQFLLGITD